MNNNCTECKKKIFIFSWLAGKNICSECIVLYQTRKKEGRCTRCNSSEKVHYFGFCQNCYLKNQIQLNQPNSELIIKNEENKAKSEILNNLGILFGIAYILLITWILFGGVFEKDTSHRTKTIDCNKTPNNEYCDGTYESEIMEQDYRENSYYQNSVR